MICLLVFQHNYLAQVTSNIWGTKFKIVGLAAFLPTNLGAGILFINLRHSGDLISVYLFIHAMFSNMHSSLSSYLQDKSASPPAQTDDHLPP